MMELKKYTGSASKKTKKDSNNFKGCSDKGKAFVVKMMKAIKDDVKLGAHGKWEKLYKKICETMNKSDKIDNFRMNTHYGRYGATYNMIGLRCFNEELSLLPKNPTEAKLQATSTRGESTEPT
jgi:hypothetical protein